MKNIRNIKIIILFLSMVLITVGVTLFSNFSNATTNVDEEFHFLGSDENNDNNKALDIIKKIEHEIEKADSLYYDVSIFENEREVEGFYLSLLNNEDKFKVEFKDVKGKKGNTLGYNSGHIWLLFGADNTYCEGYLNDFKHAGDIIFQSACVSEILEKN